MTNRISNGKTLQYSNTGSLITSGSLVILGGIVAIAITDIAATTGVGAVEIGNGIYTLTAATGAWTLGQALYVTSGGTFTTASTGNTLCGYAAAAKATAAVLGQVLLVGGR